LNRLAPGPETYALLGRLGLSVPAGSTIAVRPENLGLGGGSIAGDSIDGTVKKFTYLGREAHLQVATKVGDLVIHIANPSRSASVAVDSTVQVLVPRDGLMAADQNGKRIATGA